MTISLCFLFTQSNFLHSDFIYTGLQPGRHCNINQIRFCNKNYGEFI